MTEDLSKKGPGITDSQRIGDDARSALYANKPEQWLLGECPGDDFGYDFQVTAFGLGDSGAQYAFNIQLKGTTKEDALVEDGAYLSFAFNRTTLNLWNNSCFAILVVVADLTKSRNPKDAPVYFHLANYDLEEILPNLPPEQKTVTLRVPTSQLVHRELDILPLVQSYINEIKEARQRDREKCRATGTSVFDEGGGATVQSTDNKISEFSSPEGEIERLINSLLNKDKLTVALKALRSGDYERVLRLTIIPSTTETKEDTQEAAACAYLRSRALKAIGNSSAENEMIDVAAHLLPDNDDIATLVAQRELDTTEFGINGHDARQQLLKSIESKNGVGITNLKAKVYALEGEFDTARTILDDLSLHHSLLTKVIVSIVERDWNRALSEIAICRSVTTLLDNQLFWLDVLEAKAYLELALDGIDRPEEGDFVIPANGVPGINYSKLHLAYDASLKAMHAGQRLNWPAYIQYMLDVFPISSMLLGYEEQTLPLLSSLAFARPKVTKIREVASTFSVQYGNPQIALELRELAEESEYFEHEEAVLAVAASKTGNITKALSFVTDKFLASTSTDAVYLSSLMTLGMLSASALRLDLLEKIKNRLGSNPESSDYLAILDSAAQVQQSFLRRSEAVHKLYEYWRSQGRSKIVGYNLLDNLNPAEPKEAEWICEVASQIETVGSLCADHLIAFSQALLTLNKSADAIVLIKEANQRYVDEPRLKSILGIALEINGKSAEAFELIGQLLESGRASESAQRYFIDIAARMGFFQQAEDQIRAALAKSKTKSRSLGFLNLLFCLLLAAGNRHKDVEEIAWEYGKLVDQEDEEGEGFFLQSYLVATLSDSIEYLEERIAEFNLRLESYSKRHPTSKYLWKADIPADGPPDAILSALKKAAGITDQDIAKEETIERKMERGSLHVPFSWRPRRFLRSISNTFMLWDIHKSAAPEKLAFQLQSSVLGYDRNTPSNLNNKKIVLSLTSLLVLDEIGLLGVVLDTFQEVIVARSTLVCVQEARNTFTGGWGREQADRIMKELQQRFCKISHPPFLEKENRRNIPEWHNEEMNAMLEPDRVYFCDDIIETVMVCSSGDSEPTKSSMSTVEFLMWADQSAGRLNASQVADYLGHLIRLKVGALNIEQRYLVAAIPDELQVASTLMEENEASQNAETLRSILDGIWASSKPFDDLRTHFSSTMGYLITKGEASEAVLVTLWLRWLQAIRFQLKPERPVWWKIAISFVSVLAQIESDKSCVIKLWQSFWIVLRRGLGDELAEPEDIAGVKMVAILLGEERAKGEEPSQIGLLFDRARIGIEEGTELAAIYNETYISSAAEKAKELL